VFDVTIRRATPADANAIADVIAAIEPDKLVSEISRNERRDRFRYLLAEGFNVSFVAEAGGQVIGELTLALGHPAPAELGFGVHPAWRRQGVARSLLQQAVTWADAHDIHKLTAEVFPDNGPALKLLSEFDFVEEGYLVNQFSRKSGGANDAVLLARTA
jgi:ribosomal protein S18 acetylase RimI-like enzyme